LSPNPDQFQLLGLAWLPKMLALVQKKKAEIRDVNWEDIGKNKTTPSNSSTG